MGARSASRRFYEENGTGIILDYETDSVDVGATLACQSITLSSAGSYIGIPHIARWVAQLCRWTCDREIAGSTLGRCIAGGSLGQLSLPSLRD